MAEARETSSPMTAVFIKEEPEQYRKRLAISRKHPPKIHISIEGSIGAGKTVLLKKFYRFLKQETFLDWCKLPEPLEIWTNYGPNKENILERMYNDPQGFGFTFQMMALSSRIEQFKNYRLNRHPYLLVERTIECQGKCFSPVLRQQGSLTTTEFDILLNLINNLSDLPFYRPHVIVYLRCRPTVSLERVKERGRGEEKNMTISYLDKLQTKYDQWMLCSGETRVVEVDANNLQELNDMPKLYKRILDVLPQECKDILIKPEVKEISDEQLLSAAGEYIETDPPFIIEQGESSHQN